MPSNPGTINGGNGGYITPKGQKTKQLDDADYTYPEPHVDDYNRMTEKHNKSQPKE
jgi:hypothetical protein